MRTFGFAAAGALLLVIAEIVVFVLVAHAIGWWWAILAGIVTTVVGAVLLKREGVRAWQRLRSAVSEGRPPGGDAGTGVAGLAGALLLLAPGFITDTVGLLLLIPPVRAFAGRQIRQATEARISAAAAGDLFGPRVVKATRADPGPVPTQPGAGEILQGEVLEGDVIDPQHRHHSA
ncbi:FxsA family protein [Dactylosporangium aurantiacum]|uniref:FxsA family protein n=1 Tax=Dactylosporangium aurantiacum TaxID=35754 RepID=A0A9Q9I666_9ACTN|nr:FxsA family protein [Dactylosporangium aurantiacum]MDG6109266.1 FxsA family protein [Dactylosporangium aurantiacum]UWZ50354.1 FxsA family protein [Dactylosporangium aurantiacum]